MSRRRTRTVQVETTIEVFITVAANATVSPHDPGRTYGPPDLCYPPEGGEVEFTRIMLGDVMEVSEEALEKLFGEAFVDDLRQMAFDAAEGGA